MHLSNLEGSDPHIYLVLDQFGELIDGIGLFFMGHDIPSCEKQFRRFTLSLPTTFIKWTEAFSAKGGSAFGGKFRFKYTISMSKSPLEQSILSTLIYFDIANYPLTKEELFRYLWTPPQVTYEEFVLSLRAERSNPPEIAASVVSGNLLAMAEQKNGYYFLPGREAVVERRCQTIVPTELKLTKARRAARLLRSVPYLKAIFVCNSVGAEMATAESDIDFFIVVEKNRIWLVRFFTNLILRLFGLRTYGAHERDRICLSFYVDTAHLDLAPWRVAEDDIHFTYWLYQMLPLYDPENYYQKFVEANSWTKKFLPNINSSLKVSSNDSGSIGKTWKKIWETMWQGTYGDMLEKQAKDFQWMKMKLPLKEKSELNDNGVVIKEGIVKLHEHDTRRDYREKWLEKISNI